jgi:ferredoxin--NADP+ reductase
VRSVVVVGVGNVALDVARVLARTPEELEPTDMPQHVLDVLAAAPVEEVTCSAGEDPRRPAFTTHGAARAGRAGRRHRPGDPPTSS